MEGLGEMFSLNFGCLDVGEREEGSVSRILGSKSSLMEDLKEVGIVRDWERTLANEVGGVVSICWES